MNALKKRYTRFFLKFLPCFAKCEAVPFFALAHVFVFVFAMFFSTYGYAQKYHHYVGVKAGGGLSTLNYPLSEGNQSKGFGGLGGFTYTYFFTPSIGINTGLEMAYYNAKAKLGNYAESYAASDSENETFIFNMYLNGYRETQNLLALQIPIMLRFDISDFSLFLGGKLGIPLMAEYRTKIGQLKTTGTYVDCDDPFENMPNHGYYNLSDLKTKAPLDLGLNYMLSAEIGYSFKISKNTSFYVGVYADYGLNELRKNTTLQGNIFAYNPDNPKDLIQNSILFAERKTASATELQDFSSKLNSLSAGIVLRYSFGYIPFKEYRKRKLIDYPMELRPLRPWKRKSVLEDNTEVEKEMRQGEKRIKG